MKVTSPCPVELDAARGKQGERTWHCGHCRKDVHVLSNLTEAEARALLSEREGENLCVSYAVRRDGTIRFKPAPAVVPARALTRRRASAVAAAGLGAALAACTPHDNDEVESPNIAVEMDDPYAPQAPTIPDADPEPEPELQELEVEPEHVEPEHVEVEPDLQIDGGMWAEPVPPPRPGGLVAEPPPPDDRSEAVDLEPLGGVTAAPLPPLED